MSISTIYEGVKPANMYTFGRTDKLSDILF